VFASRLLTSAERNYTITEKECLAIVRALKKFKPFVCGADIVVVTDHHSLCWLLTKRDLRGLLARWSQWCQEYRLKIFNKSGRLHIDADPLSRYPIETTEQSEELIDSNHPIFNTIQILEADVLKMEKRKHKTWKNKIQKLENTENHNKGRYHLINGLLYIKPAQVKDRESRLGLPPGPIRDYILSENHDQS